MSQTSDPLGNYTVFGWDPTDASNPLGDCPCFGDFDQIGADANGIYVTTNEFANTSVAPGYNGTVLYACRGRGLEARRLRHGPRQGLLLRHHGRCVWRQHPHHGQRPLPRIAGINACRQHVRS